MFILKHNVTASDSHQTFKHSSNTYLLVRGFTSQVILFLLGSLASPPFSSPKCYPPLFFLFFFFFCLCVELPFSHGCTAMLRLPPLVAATMTHQSPTFLPLLSKNPPNNSGHILHGRVKSNDSHHFFFLFFIIFYFYFYFFYFYFYIFYMFFFKSRKTKWCENKNKNGNWN